MTTATLTLSPHVLLTTQTNSSRTTDTSIASSQQANSRHQQPFSMPNGPIPSSQRSRSRHALVPTTSPALNHSHLPTTPFWPRQRPLPPCNSTTAVPQRPIAAESNDLRYIPFRGSFPTLYIPRKRTINGTFLSNTLLSSSLPTLTFFYHQRLFTLETCNRWNNLYGIHSCLL